MAWCAPTQLAGLGASVFGFGVSGLKSLPLDCAVALAPETPVSAVCAIDFGTSNSAVSLPSEGRCDLVELEPGYVTMPTAVFYAVEGRSMFQEPQQHYGRAALAAYLEGTEGRLMRSMKSILGSPLAAQTTDVGGGHGVAYMDVITSYLRHLKARAERQAQCSITRAVLGRPVHFVDDDAERDAAAQAALKLAAEAVGFEEVTFQYEPIAAALDYETTVDREQVVLVVDIGGGTSDFSLVRVGPEHRQRIDRRADVLANHGVHIAGTDFDRQIDLQRILPICGFRGLGPNGREVPSRVYFDLATWHLINTVYSKGRVAELKRMKSFYADESQYRRLMTVMDEHLGHELMGRAEAAKIDVSKGGQSVIDLSMLEPGLCVDISEADVIEALGSDFECIAHAATETIRQAGLAPGQVDVL